MAKCDMMQKYVMLMVILSFGAAMASLCKRRDQRWLQDARTPYNV